MLQLKPIYLFLILISPLLISAQDEAAPLIERMHRADGVEKIDILNEISAVYRKTDRSKSLEYARQAFKLSLENNYLPGKALAKKNEGIGWFFIGSNDSALTCYKQALEIYTEMGDKKGMSACYNNLGLIFQETGKYDEALKYYQQSIQIDHKLGDEIGVATTKRNLVDIYIYKGESLKALALSNEIIHFCSNQSDGEGLMWALINRAAVYDNLKQYGAAVADQKAAIAIAQELKNTYAEAMALSNFGLVTWHKGNPDEALKILNQVLGMSDGDEGGYDILNTLWIMSEIYTSKKEYAASNEILQKVLKRYELSDNKREEAKVLTSLGRNLIELNEIDKAMGYLLKSLEISAELKAPFEMLENYRNLAHVNAILHNFKAADSLQDLFAETYSTLFNTDSIAIIRKERLKDTEMNIPSISSTTDWIIAFSLMLVILWISVVAYNNRGKEE